MSKWCTVTIADGEGKRYSVDVKADSSRDAPHLFVTHVRNNPTCGIPIPTSSTQFEVVADGHSVSGGRLKKWFEKRRSEWKGPRGMPFSQRPMIGDQPARGHGGCEPFQVFNEFRPARETVFVIRLR
jgi:hypothetical protein